MRGSDALRRWIPVQSSAELSGIFNDVCGREQPERSVWQRGWLSGPFLAMGLCLALSFELVRPLNAQDIDTPLLVTSVPEALVEEWGLDPYYKKHVSAGGFPVLSSDKVQDPALREAGYLINRMLEGRDDLRQAMISNRVRFVVMAANEYTTQVPEHATLEPARFWDKRARGLGASRSRPVVSCGEENLLGYPGDPYFEENILIHEFAHAIHSMGLNSVDPTFDRRLREAYREAMDTGRWKGTYAAVNAAEYWAEGVQSWFDCNRENDAQHNHVSTRELLKEYDPPLSQLIEEVFGDKPWRYLRPSERPMGEGTRHLDGYDPKSAPRFAWPQELLDWNRTYALQVNKPESALNILTLGPVDPDPLSKPVSTLRDASILFHNLRDQPVALHQLNMKRERTWIATLNPGEVRRIHTYAGQTWLIAREDGVGIGTVVAGFEPAKLDIP